MDFEHATKRPEDILKALGQGHIALAAQNHMGMLEAAIGQPKVIQAMIQRFTSDGYTQFAHGGEIRKAHLARFMDLPEHYLLLRAMLRIPGPYPPLQSATNTAAKLWMSAQNLFVNGDWADPW
jgi:hypothetical protein